MSDDIKMLTARLTIEYGLDEDGDGIITECWENVADPEFPVPMITKAGLLTMAQHSLTWLALGLDEEDDDD